MYFPSVYDIKYLMKFCDNLHGGLNKLAECLDVNRIGPQHQVISTTFPLMSTLTWRHISVLHPFTLHNFKDVTPGLRRHRHARMQA